MTIDIGASNQFVPGGDRGQPRVFHPGRHPEEVAVSFTENGLVWQLDGSTAVAHPDLLPCTATQVDHLRALRQAQRAVQIMRTIADPAQRQFVSAVALNALSSLNRAITGSRANDIEKRIADYLGGLDPASRAFAERSGRGLPLIPPEVRAELLGPMGNFDPGDGSSPSDWDTLLGPTMSNINPRLRTNFCALPTTDVTSGMFDTLAADPDPHEPVPAAFARPTVKGIQRNTVVSPHPALIADHDANRAFGPGPEGDGFFAGGVRVETLQCPCDSTQGLLCSADLRGEPPNSGDRCMAFPIIRQGADFTLRGHNFWDAESAGIVLNPVGGGNGVVATMLAHESGVDTNGTDRDCLDSNGKTNITHDSLTFRTSATPGFYRMRVFNQNGKYRLRQESPMAPGRTVHVCWKFNGQNFPPEPTTNLSCAENGVAGTTCPADGAPCPANAWTVAPRPLDAACQHSFLQPVRCGETPAWFGSEADPRFQPIVAVQSGDANFEMKVFRQSVEAVEESGWDSFGEDETQIFLAAFTDKDSSNGINSLDELKQQAGSLGPDDYDTGTRRVFNPTLPPNANQILARLRLVGQDDPIAFGMQVLEIDCKPCIIAAIGLIGAAVGAGICYFGGPVACAVGGGAAAMLTITAMIIVASSDVDDNMGVLTWKGTPRNVSDRISTTHFVDFLPNYTAYNSSPGPLPPLEPAGPVFGTARARLMHPFAVDGSYTHVVTGSAPQSGVNLPAVECNPGTCPTGLVCSVNRCVQPGSGDPTAMISFIEQRDVNANDGDSFYGVDLLYERRQCVPSTSSPTQVVCQ